MIASFCMDVLNFVYFFICEIEDSYCIFSVHAQCIRSNLCSSCRFQLWRLVPVLPLERTAREPVSSK